MNLVLCGEVAQHGRSVTPIFPESVRHLYILLPQLAKAEMTVCWEVLGVYRFHPSATQVGPLFKAFLNVIAGAWKWDEGSLVGV